MQSPESWAARFSRTLNNPAFDAATEPQKLQFLLAALKETRSHEGQLNSEIVARFDFAHRQKKQIPQLQKTATGYRVVYIFPGLPVEVHAQNNNVSAVQQPQPIIESVLDSSFLSGGIKTGKPSFDEVKKIALAHSRLYGYVTNLKRVELAKPSQRGDLVEQLAFLENDIQARLRIWSHGEAASNWEEVIQTFKRWKESIAAIEHINR